MGLSGFTEAEKTEFLQMAMNSSLVIMDNVMNTTPVSLEQNMGQDKEICSLAKINVSIKLSSSGLQPMKQAVIN